MDFANSLLQLVNNLWDLASRPLCYICNLKDNVDSLRNKTDKLKAKSKTVLARVEIEEGRGDVHRTEEVAYWLDTVQKFVGRVDQIHRDTSEHYQIKCLSRCLPPNCWSSYKLGKRVDQMLNEARELQLKEGEFNVLTSTLPPPLVLNMPMDETVGFDISRFNEVWNWVTDKKQGRVIGLCGVGGVGKTTFMRRIQKKLLHANNGFVVIWVLVSNPMNKERIQDDIRRGLHLEGELWERGRWDERVHNLCQALTRKKFVLLLDDLWEWLDLSEIGVPCSSLQDGSKVVFTTRQKQVCHQMAANEIFEIPCLTPEKALELFKNKVGRLTIHSHPQIPELAETVVEECRGLPLALIVVGRAMAGRTDIGEWKHALAMLRNNPHKLSGMEEVYRKLAFSYDSLNDSCQRCFLYCCLFPEDYLIRTDELIELWIGGGLLGGTNDVHILQNEGKYVLGSLKMACLLESEIYRSSQCVKMHDVIRDMAIWITRDRGQNEIKLPVIEKDEDMSVEMISKWGEAEKISLWGKFIKNIPETLPACSQLQILFVRETKVTLVPRGLFDSACLTVLDLSRNRHLRSFPEEICNLICLRYLNLSSTDICELPREIEKLTHLRWLLLDETSEHFLIPPRAIASLPLNVFSQWESSIDYSKAYLISTSWGYFPGQSNEKEIIEELECMQHLTSLSISLSKASSALKIFQSPNLQRSITKARIKGCQDLADIIISYSPTVSGVFLHLKELYLEDCPMLREMEITQRLGRAPDSFCFPSLADVFVRKCGLLNLSLLAHAPKLSTLRVLECDSLEKIIGDGYVGGESAASGLFSHLHILILEDLPSLTSIYNQTLPFPQLKSLHIHECPHLGKLPLDSNSARGSLEELTINDHLWDNLEWDDDAARSIFAAVVSYHEGSRPRQVCGE